MMGNAQIAITIAEKFVPFLSAPRRSFCSAFSPVLTRKVPIIETTTPTAAISIGTAIALKSPLNAATPRADAEITELT
jgi:hypothetical protein